MAAPGRRFAIAAKASWTPRDVLASSVLESRKRSRHGRAFVVSFVADCVR